MAPHRFWTIGPLLIAGVGFGGFFDGIAFHQVLQWHHVASQQVETHTHSGLERNVFWDGVFHSAMWFVAGASVALLWEAARQRAVPRSAAAVAGLLLIGWGAFNVFDGTVLHFALNLHNAREGENELAWNLAWLGWGAAFIAGGWLLAFRGTTLRGEPARSPA